MAAPWLIAAGAVAAGLFVYKGLQTAVLTVKADLEAVRRNKTPEGTIQLVQDPISGEYRPRKES